METKEQKASSNLPISKASYPSFQTRIWTEQTTILQTNSSNVFKI